MGLQDLTTWTETDAAGDLTVTSGQITVDTIRRDATARVSLDMGASNIGNFSVDFETQVTAEQETGIFSPFCVSSALDSLGGHVTNNSGVLVSWYYGNPYWRLSLADYVSVGDPSQESLYSSTRPGKKYLTLTRSGATWTLKIYSDSGRTSLDATLTFSGTSTALRYFQAATGRGASGESATISGTVGEIDLSWHQHTASDGAKFGDTAEADFKNRGEVADGAGIGDTVEGFDFNGGIADGAGVGDAVAAESEINEAAADAAGIGDAVNAFSLSDSFDLTVGVGDAVDAGFERVGELVDAAGIGDAADAFNWTTWLRANLDQAVARFYLTLTGAADGTTDVEIPISSFQARKRTGYETYISAVIPGLEYAEEIADRSNGQMIVEMAYLVGGVESIREEILRADLEKIMIQKGPMSRSITLYGRRAETFVGTAARLTKPIYSSQYEGRMTYRFAIPDPYLKPGDAVTVEDDEGTDVLTVDQVTYIVSTAGGTTSMEIQE
jgi:hypothetical protein